MKNYASKLGMRENRLKVQFKDWYRMEINSKAFAIPILTAILSTINQMQLANCLRIYFHSIATLELYLQLVSMLFDP